MGKSPADIAKEEAENKAARMAAMKEKAERIRRNRADVNKIDSQIADTIELQHRQNMNAVGRLDARAGLAANGAQINVK